MAVAAGSRIGGQAQADLGVADQAGAERDQQVEDVAALAAIEHEPAVGEQLQRFRLQREIGLAQPPLPAIGDVQADLAVEQVGQQPRGAAHAADLRVLVDRERIGAGVLHQVEIVLHQIGTERVCGQRARGQCAEERVVDVGVPLDRAILPEPGEQAAFRQVQAAISLR